jgi:hypothetical protein
VFDKVLRPLTSAPSPAIVGQAAGLALGTAIVFAGFALETPLRAQQAATPPAAAAAEAPAPVPQGPPPGYAYDPAGRRDPFISLNRASVELKSGRGRVSGLAGLAISEATVKGVVKSQGRLVAMLQAPDNKTYIVKANDKLLDGAVRAVTPEAVVFVQHVNDPLKMVTQREIRKPLRIVEEGK